MQMIVVQLINHHFEACSPFIFEKKKKVKIRIHLCYHYRKKWLHLDVCWQSSRCVVMIFDHNEQENSVGKKYPGI